MAFMMPVMKNDWDIYKSNRSRRSSECSNPQTCRSRKVSECSKSDGPSLSTSPGSDFMVNSPAHRSIPANMTSRQYSVQISSRNSACSLQSPGKSTSSSPPKTSSQSSLNKFHNRLVDKLKRSLRHKDSSTTGPRSSGRRRSKSEGRVRAYSDSSVTNYSSVIAIKNKKLES